MIRYQSEEEAAEEEEDEDKEEEEEQEDQQEPRNLKAHEQTDDLGKDVLSNSEFWLHQLNNRARDERERERRGERNHFGSSPNPPPP